MRCLLPFVALASAALASGGPTVSVDVRGRTHLLARMNAAPQGNVAVVFLPGDGGWRGTAIDISRAIASWGYDVYGFDTKRYLECRSKHTLDDMAADMRGLAAQINATTGRRVIFVGWSQGAGMAIAAISGGGDRYPVRGVVTLGLPTSAVLGWDWKATIATLAGRETDQPKFDIKPLLRTPSRVPVWMIYGSDDEFTSSDLQKDLFQAAGQPKEFQQIAGANHRFDGHLDELYRSMKAGIEWLLAS